MATHYVNVTPEVSGWRTIPAQQPDSEENARHPTMGAAHDAQVREGWTMLGAALIVMVNDDGINLGLA